MLKYDSSYDSQWYDIIGISKMLNNDSSYDSQWYDIIGITEMWK